MCKHFKTQCTKEPLIEFEDTSMPPTIETYQRTPIEDAWKRALNRLDSYLHNDHEIWRMASTKAEGTTPKKIQEIKNNPWTPEYNKPDYLEDDFRTNIRNWPQLYCNKCDLMFNLPPRILFSITKLSEPEEEILITKNMSFQDSTEDTETEHDNKEGICSKRVHDTNTSFDLRYSGQSPIIIAPHFFVKIDLKIVLEIPVSTMVQVAFQSSLAKKKIDVKGGIIDAGYMENIIMMLQNNSNRPYKIESQEKIAQAIFLLLVKIPQLTPITTQEDGRENVPVNFMEKNSDQIQDQALLFEASPKICFLANVANLYLPAKVHKHFKISIHNPTEDVIEIPKETLISFISTDIQNPEKPQFISDFTQLFLFCDITSQVWNLPKESYLFTPEEINKLNLGNLSTLQQMQLKVLLNQYADVFASKNEFGCTDIVKH
ncbi:hypothetical protein G9A89_016261 [Geosiphon pyriformis]|nr:hypothetical protein G9A89_016261 [Geosiphon pyriformis]